jgi:uridylate kinase
MPRPLYQRVVVKLSGEALAGPDGFGLHQPTVERIADDLVAARALGVGIAVVIGGGNLFRGVEVSKRGVSRPTGDTIGMLATVMNSLVMEAALVARGQPARTLSALAMPEVCELYTRARALDALAEGRIVLLAAGTGNPFFTTDTTAVLRAAELEADAVFKATNVDGVYSADPRTQPDAVRFERISHGEALARDLKVMDSTAFALARENHMPIIVFSIRAPRAVERVLCGEGQATTVGG